MKLPEAPKSRTLLLCLLGAGVLLVGSWYFLADTTPPKYRVVEIRPAGAEYTSCRLTPEGYVVGTTLDDSESPAEGFVLRNEREYDIFDSNTTDRASPLGVTTDGHPFGLIIKKQKSIGIQPEVFIKTASETVRISTTEPEYTADTIFEATPGHLIVEMKESVSMNPRRKHLICSVAGDIESVDLLPVRFAVRTHLQSWHKEQGFIGKIVIDVTDTVISRGRHLNRDYVLWKPPSEPVWLRGGNGLGAASPMFLPDGRILARTISDDLTAACLSVRSTTGEWTNVVEVDEGERLVAFNHSGTVLTIRTEDNSPLYARILLRVVSTMKYLGFDADWLPLGPERIIIFYRIHQADGTEINLNRELRGIIDLRKAGLVDIDNVGRIHGIGAAEDPRARVQSNFLLVPLDPP